APSRAQPSTAPSVRTCGPTAIRPCTRAGAAAVTSRNEPTAAPSGTTSSPKRARWNAAPPPSPAPRSSSRPRVPPSANRPGPAAAGRVGEQPGLGRRQPAEPGAAVEPGAARGEPADPPALQPELLQAGPGQVEVVVAPAGVVAPREDVGDQPLGGEPHLPLAVGPRVGRRVGAGPPVAQRGVVERPAQVGAQDVENGLLVAGVGAREPDQRVQRTDPHLVGLVAEQLDGAGEPLVGDLDA